MVTKLCTSNLAQLTASASIPAYDRKELTPGILHFGVGNFHRAHQAMYLERLFDQGFDHDWAVVGAGVMPSDERMRQALLGQDFLSTVVEQSAAESRARVLGSMIDFLPPGRMEETINILADPAIRIVSLTVTEGGYYIDPASGLFAAGHPDIVADAAAPDRPKTVFGLICAGLKRRRAEAIPPFTLMSCDNVPHNGDVTRNAVAGLARLSDPGFADWIERHVAFPNGMVDRITPATGERERRLLAERFGIEDVSPVFCEAFTQWVLEDRFPTGRPALEKVGVQFVPDVSPYEHMKIRILNGGHALIAYPAGLLEIRFAQEAVAHPLLRGFLEKVEREEIIPIVPPVPATDLGSYFRVVEERFENPKIGDTVQRLCYDGSNRQPKFIIPSIADRVKAGAGVEGLALASAFWCRYCFGLTENGMEIAANDPNWDRLNSTARAAKENPMEWLAMEDIYGDLGRVEFFRRAFAESLSALWSEGVESVLKRYLGGNQ